MKSRDLGEVTAPLLIFGGPYSNLQATDALIAQAGRLGIPPERWICTGDVAAYCADPEETAQRLMATGAHLVFGNCEDSLGNRLDDCGCGFADGTACDALAGQWYAHADARLSEASRAWMRKAPRTIAFQMAGCRFLCVHGSPGQINRFVFPSNVDAVDAAEFDGVDGIIAGHSGIPFSQIVRGKFWHNAGAIGMPANDGTHRVWYSVIRPDAGGLGVRISHHALDHDGASAARSMRDAGLAEGYASCLETGLWPSLDVLPDAEKLAAGQALDPGAHKFKALDPMG